MRILIQSSTVTEEDATLTDLPPSQVENTITALDRAGESIPGAPLIATVP